MSEPMIRAAVGAVPSPDALTAPRRAARSLPLLILVLLLVNAAAIWGQAGWAWDHIVPAGTDWRAGIGLSLGFAAALELIGVFLATAADQAEDAGQIAGGIRIGSYGMGLISGTLNLSHWGWHTSAAIAFGCLSAVSPFLWGVYARVRRGRPVAPSRRFWHPFRSIGLIRFMAWEGIPSEDDAIREMAFRTDPESAPVSPGTGYDRAELGRVAIARKRENPGESWEKIAADLQVSASYLWKCRQAAGGGAR